MNDLLEIMLKALSCVDRAVKLCALIALQQGILFKSCLEKSTKSKPIRHM